MEFFGVPVSEFLKLPVRDVLPHCQQFLSDFGMSELGDRWTSQNTDPTVREFFSRLAEKGKQAQEIFFCSLITALEKVDESVTRNIRDALFIGKHYSFYVALRHLQAILQRKFSVYYMY